MANNGLLFSQLPGMQMPGMPPNFNMQNMQIPTISGMQYNANAGQAPNAFQSLSQAASGVNPNPLAQNTITGGLTNGQSQATQTFGRLTQESERPKAGNEVVENTSTDVWGKLGGGALGLLTTGGGSLIGAAMGGLMGSTSDFQKHQTDELQTVKNQLGADRSRILGQSAEANRQAKAGVYQDQAAYQTNAALNSAAGSNVSNGDVAFGSRDVASSAAKAALATAGANQGLAQGYSEKAQEQSNQNQQLTQNTQALTDASDRLNYLTTQQGAGNKMGGLLGSALTNALPSFLGGMNAFKSGKNLIDNVEGSLEKKERGS